MTAWQIIVLVLGGCVAAAAAVAVAIRAGVRPDAGGEESAGLAVFCGGLRWFGGRWGLRCVPAGLRKAGFAGRFIYWPWHGRWTGPVLTSPALWDVALHERHSEEIAACIADFRTRHPEAPVYVLGCSAGGQVALRALERLPRGVRATSAALLSAAVDGRRDLSAVLAHLDGPLVNSCSILDALVLGLGTLVFGTGDRKHALSAGMVGLKATDDRIVNIPWRPRMFLSGRLGGHSSCTPPKYIARWIAPAMGIGSRKETR